MNTLYCGAIIQKKGEINAEYVCDIGVVFGQIVNQPKLIFCAMNDFRT
jgi:hypothetical protein